MISEISSSLRSYLIKSSLVISNKRSLPHTTVGELDTGVGIFLESADIYIEATNKVIKLLARKQIIQAFKQSEKEVEDLHQRTREGIETARLNGKQIGQKSGNKLHIKKEAPAKEKIRKYNRDFEGNLTDIECMKLIGISRNTYYKYKREIDL